ncbi:MAG: DUF3990 domain-containing protein [Bacteroidales bacterium]|jgi:hypothetical protein|nr:DUF3990 domain-containing protein [Bacteroidales bacterium]MBR4273734.1 DUF3990 domain-containing protein [Bacteroidales bacterium]
MILYHGSNISFDEIDLQKSKPNKDFGKGFYLSPNYMQAMEMAKIKTEQLKFGSPKVMTFEFDDKNPDLKIKRFEKYSEEWAKFILLNRNNRKPTPAHDYDVVIGPIADDRVGVQLWKYESKLIDLKTLTQNLRYMKGITIQYFFGTEKAIKTLTLL